MQEADFIVVGAGAAGCALAGRLTEDPNVSVCLLEAGKRDDSWRIQVPLGFAFTVPTRAFNWAFETVPQPGLNGRRGYQPRGKTLGGSSSINAMMYVRGHRRDYDHWAALGNAGWSYDEVLPYFRKSENNADLRTDYHGNDGPLHVSYLRSPSPFFQLCIDAAVQAGFRHTHDFNGAQQEGIGYTQVMQKNGERCSAAKAFITPNLSRRNLRVETNACTTRILFEGRRAVGVEYRQGGKTHTIRARREVVVCAGAFQSPQLLMLSGIGDSEELRRHGIPVLHHLPGVGRNLQDHLDINLNYRASHPDLIATGPATGAALLKGILPYRRERRGIWTSNFAEVNGFLKSAPELPAPDLQIEISRGITNDHGRKKVMVRGFCVIVTVLRPRSIGRVGLASANPADAPLIDPNFLGHPDDLELFVKGIKIARQIIASPLLDRYRGAERYTGHARTDDELRDIVRERADTNYHPVGSCKMGIDEMAVVDPQLRVRGIAGLRVVDASIMPTLVGGNTCAPSIMIGEKGAQLIKDQYQGSAAPDRMRIFAEPQAAALTDNAPACPAGRARE
ncbi:GMC family oxidoreductase [Noviherbaspirillum sp. UKPF54]|uniref:GMC family oxidoreductase n=1 Tax=Noviherbaspirillum sp. UKPF54 TaxID=2601898 RepID=UPI0011B1821D|nr:choline dehydrogenase [Noviherbaspirillum sp. UKPF54]QDZ29394.1 choline dehydrogenase [Noviherbaspirillum sp. UKPF54]